jgi:hypothetical protein
VDITEQSRMGRMLYNGPAIWGGCVTRRKHRSRPVLFSQKAVTVQGRYGTCFCSPGTIVGLE